MSLHEELVESLAFNKEWQEQIRNKPIKNNDYLFVFNLIYFFIPIQDKFKPSETENFQRLCFKCLINFLLQDNKNLGLALKLLNESFDDLMSADLNEPLVKKFKNSMNNFIYRLYLKYPAKKTS